MASSCPHQTDGCGLAKWTNGDTWFCCRSCERANPTISIDLLENSLPSVLDGPDGQGLYPWMDYKPKEHS